MKRDFVEALIMGYLATYLPVFDFDVSRWLVTICFAWPIFILLVGTDKEPVEKPNRLQMIRVGNNTYLYLNTKHKKMKVERLAGGGKKWAISRKA